MNADPVVKYPIISQRLADVSTAIPAAWRTRQYGAIGLIALAALWYAAVGWHSPAGETGRADHLGLWDFAGFIALGAAVWLTTPTTWTIAATTFHESIRKRWLTALLGFALVMLAVSTFFTWMQPGEEQKFMRDFGVGFTMIMTLIVSIFLGVALIPPEVERRTIFTILSKPVNRLEFLLGKFEGLALVLLLNLVLMSVMFLLAYALFVIQKEGFSSAFQPDVSGISPKGLPFDLRNLALALSLQYGLLLIMAAAAIFLSQLLSGMTAIISCFVLYFVGQSAPYFEHLSGEDGMTQKGLVPLLSPSVSAIVGFIYVFLPRFDRFEARERLVNDLPIGLNYLVKAGASGVVYTAVLLALAYYSFSDREF